MRTSLSPGPRIFPVLLRALRKRQTTWIVSGTCRSSILSCAPNTSAQEKERRTKDARRTPAKGRRERTLADAPCGARAQGTASLHETWRFSTKQRLDAHASVRIVVGPFRGRFLRSGTLQDSVKPQEKRPQWHNIRHSLIPYKKKPQTEKILRWARKGSRIRG